VKEGRGKGQGLISAFFFPLPALLAGNYIQVVNIAMFNQHMGCRYFDVVMSSVRSDHDLRSILVIFDF